MQGWQPAVATAPTPTPDIVEIDLELAIPGVVSLYVFLQAGQIVGVDRVNWLQVVPSLRSASLWRL